MSNRSSALELCTEKLSHPRITVRASGRTATFLNHDREEINKVDIDCWLSSTADARADYILCKPGVVDVIIELKGKDIDHGVEQILATHAVWKKIPSCSAKIGGLIVFTRSPKRSTMLDNMKAKLLVKHKIWLDMGKSGLKEYTFETFTGERP
jgi:hypothetical protein